MKTVLFQAIKFRIIHCLVLFDPSIGPYLVLPLRAREEQEAISIKDYSSVSKLQHY